MADSLTSGLKAPQLEELSIDDIPLYRLDTGAGWDKSNERMMASFMATAPDSVVYTGKGEVNYPADRLSHNQYLPEAVEQEEVATGDIFGAAFRQENSAGSYLSNQVETQGVELGYNVFDDSQIEGYEDFVENWGFSLSREETASIIRQLDQEQTDKQYLQQGGGRAIGAMLTAGALDPIFWPVMFAPVLNSVKAGKPFLTARNWAAGGFVSEAMAEAVKHNTQLTRTQEETLWALGASTLLSGVLGGAISQISGNQVKKLTKEVAKDLRGEYARSAKFVGPQPEFRADTGVGTWNKSLSAAEVEKRTLEDYELVGALGLEKIKANPIIRMSQSPVLAVRKLGLWLANTPYYHKGHAKGLNLGSELGSIESRTKAYDAIYAASSQRVDQLYFEYRKANTKVSQLKTGIDDLTGRSTDQGFLKFNEFAEEVSRAMRRGDKHKIPEVQKAAQEIRANVFEPIVASAQKLKMLPENLDSRTSMSYLTRMFDKQAIAEDVVNKDGKTFREVLIDYFEGEQQLLRNKVDRFNLQNDGKKQVVADLNQDLDSLEEFIKRVDGEVTDIQRFLKQYDVDTNKPHQVARALGLSFNPKSMASFLRDSGGISDIGGELAARDITNKTFVGLINNKQSDLMGGKAGKGTDETIEVLFDNGYFPDRASVNDVTFDDVVVALERDIFDEKIYARGIGERVEQVRQVQNTEFYRSMQENGLNFRSGKGAVKEFLLKTYGRSPEISDDLANLRTKVKDETNALGKMIKETDEFIDYLNLERLDFEELADETIGNILGTSSGRMDSKVLPNSPAIKASPLKERVLMVPDELIEEFLENDIDTIVKAYVKSMAPQIELVRDFGDIDMKAIKAGIIEDYNKVRDAKKIEMQKKGASEDDIKKAMAALRKQEKRDFEDLDAMRKQLLGEYKQPERPEGFWYRLGNAVKRVNLLRLLGGMTVSAIPDLARPIMTRGFKPFAKTLTKVNTSVYKMAIEDIKKAGVGWEAILNSRAYSWADITDDMMHRTKAERAIDSAANNFGKVSGMTYWNDMLKQFSGVMVQDEIVSTAVKFADGGKLTSKQTKELARAGISHDMARTIAEQAKRHGTTKDGLWIPNMSAWDTPAGRDAQRALRSAILKATDEIIVTPSIGEMPLWVKGPVASHIMQFKSFILSAHSKVLMSGLQARDQAALTGLLGSVFLGSMVYTTKSAIAGREIDTDNWGNFVFESVDRSGVLGWLMEPVQIANKATRGQVNPKNLWGGGGGELSRYASRNVWGALLGPTTDLVGDLFTTTGALSTGEVSEGDVKAMKRMLPYQNLFYMNALLTAISDDE